MNPSLVYPAFKFNVYLTQGWKPNISPYCLMPPPCKCVGILRTSYSDSGTCGSGMFRQRWKFQNAEDRQGRIQECSRSFAISLSPWISYGLLISWIRSTRTKDLRHTVAFNVRTYNNTVRSCCKSYIVKTCENYFYVAYVWNSQSTELL